MRSVICLLAMIATGCTSHLEVSQASTDVASRTGFAYPLQFTQWTVNLKRRLASCAPGVEALIKAEATSAAVDDGDHVYVISSDSLISPMKVSDLQVAWDKGRLKSVNASIEDRTAQTALAAVQGVGKLLSFAGKVGLLGVAGGPRPALANGRQVVCRQETVSNLQIVEQQEAEVARAGAAIAAATAEAGRIKDQLSQVGEDADLSGQLKVQLAKVDTERKALAASQKTLEHSLAFLTHDQVVTWPQRSNVNWTTDPYQIPASALNKWFAVVNVVNGTPQANNDGLMIESDPSAQDVRDIRPFFDVFMRLERIGSYGRDPSSAAFDPAALVDSAARTAGIRYRLPAQGRLVVCQAVLCDSSMNESVVANSPGPVLQLGHLFYARFSSQPLTNGTFAIAFDEYGRPVTAGISRKNSSAEQAAGLGKDLATEIATVGDELYRSPLEQLQEQRLFLEESKKLADARVAASGERSALQQLQDEIALAKARKDYTDAMAALETNPNADTRVLQAGFEADTALLKAKADLIAAEIALEALAARRSGNAAP